MPQTMDRKNVMKKRLRKAEKILILTIMAIFSLYLLTLVIIHLPPVQNFILSIVEKQINQSIQGKIEIGSFRTNLITSIAFSNISGSTPGQDSLYIERLYADYSVLALFDRSLRISLAGINEGHLTVVRDSTGIWQFPLLPKETDAPATPEKAPENVWTLAVDSGIIADLDITIIDKQDDLTIAIQSFKSGVTPRSLDSISAWFSAQQLSVHSPWWNGVLDTLFSRGTVLDSVVKLQHFFLAGNEARIEVKGTVPLSSKSAFDIYGTFGARLEPFSVLLPEQDSMMGSFEGEFTGEGTLQSPVITSQITSSNLRFREYVIDSLNVKAHYTQEEHLELVSFITSRSGTATIEGAVGIPGLFTSPLFTGYSADASIDVKNLYQVVQMVSADFEKVKGSAQLNLHVKSDVLIEVPDTADLTLVIVESGPYKLDTARAHIALHNAHWQVQALAGTGNEISGNGLFRIPKTLSGQLQGDIANPHLLSSIFLQEPLTGALAFSSSFTDLLDTPELQVQLHSDSLAWRGAVARELDAVVHYDREFLIDYARMLLTADLGEMNLPPLDSADGLLTAKITAEGNVLSPRSEARVQLIDPVYRSFSADQIDVHLIYDNEILHWDSLNAVNDTLKLTSEGQVDFLLPYRYVQAGLNLEVRGVPAAGVTISGTQNDDSIRAEVLVDHLIPGRFATGFPRFPCYEGKAALQAVTTNNNCLMLCTVNYDFIQFAPKLEPFLVSGGLHYKQSVLGGSILIREQMDELSRLTAVLDLRLRNPVCPGKEIRFGEGSTIQINASDLEYGQMVKAFLPRLTATGTVDSELRLVFRDDKWNMDGTLNAYADTLVYPPANLSAFNLRVALQPHGSIDFPQGKFSIAASQLVYENEPVMDVVARGIVHTSRVVIDTLHGNITGGGSISVSGIIPYTLGTPGGAETHFTFNLDRLPVTLANPFLQMVTLTDGMISGKGQVNFGERINANGELILSDGRFVNEMCAGTAGPLNALITLAGDSIILCSLNGKLGGGSVHGEGFVLSGSDGIKDFGIELRIKGTQLNCDLVTLLGIDNAVINYTKRDTGYYLTANVSLNDTRIHETITIPDVIGEITGEGIPSATASPVIKKTEVDATLVLNNNLLIDTNFGRLLLDGRMVVAGTLAQPSFNGVLQVVEGRIIYLDRDFNITEGTLRQYDPFEIDPELNISAISEVTTIDQEEPEEYTVTVTVRGTLRKPEISVISDPPLERPQIISLLTLGRVVAPEELQARAGEITSAQITGLGTQFLEQAFNIDNISITGNIFSIPQGGGLTITVSEKITSNLSVVYQTDLTDPSNQGASINYRLFPHFRIIAQSSTEGTTDVGFRYTIRR
ncbi:MAG: translocation/assembly module TamB domain-containing protein [Chitinispirillaceae bacterium]|nr:translocation/assembly module TamB domain-containing protein [Chitinispirillaceae bacterium]